MKIYELVWRNKYLTADADNLGSMVRRLREATELLDALLEKGVTLDPESDVSGDFARLVTSDPEVAAEFGFVPEEADAGT